MCDALALLLAPGSHGFLIIQRERSLGCEYIVECLIFFFPSSRTSILSIYKVPFAALFRQLYNSKWNAWFWFTVVCSIWWYYENHLPRLCGICHLIKICQSHFHLVVGSSRQDKFFPRGMDWTARFTSAEFHQYFPVCKDIPVMGHFPVATFPLLQWSATGGPQAKTGPSSVLIWPTRWIWKSD